jgi:hypothetical protein
MAIETLSPTTSTEGTGTFTNTSNMYDANDTTLGTMGAATDADAEVAMEGMPADSDPNNRASVKVRAKIRYPANADQYDKIAVYFRPTGASGWTKIDEDTWGVGGASANWNTSPTAAAWREFDVTATAGTNASTGFEIGVQFYNGSVGSPTLPSFDVT